LTSKAAGGAYGDDGVGGGELEAWLLVLAEVVETRLEPVGELDGGDGAVFFHVGDVVRVLVPYTLRAMSGTSR
jgi:hypothetical protein